MVSRRTVEPTRNPSRTMSGEAPSSAINNLLSTPSGNPAAAAILSGSGGSKRMSSSAMIDPRHRRLQRNRHPLGQFFEQPAIALAQPPVGIGAALVVADVILDRDAVELGPVSPGAAGVEQLVP